MRQEQVRAGPARLQASDASKKKRTARWLGLPGRGTTPRLAFFRLTAFLIVAVCVTSVVGAGACCGASGGPPGGRNCAGCASHPPVAQPTARSASTAVHTTTSLHARHV